MLKGAFLWANSKTAGPTGKAVSLYSGGHRFSPADCKTNRMLGVDCLDRVTAAVIGISHSAEYLWRGQVKPHSIKWQLLLQVDLDPLSHPGRQRLKGHAIQLKE